ncbi:MAG: archaeal proteasome endopeptidase complex subunit beta [archaeon]
MDEKLKEHLKGTTTVGIACQEGVVLAADKRSTMGYLVADKEAQKVWKIDDHIGLTIAGGVGDNLTIIRLMRAEAALYKLQYKAMPVEAAATLLSNILNQQRYYPLMTQLIIGGYDTEPRLFEMDMVGGMTQKDYSSTGSGSPVAYGVLEAEFKKGLTLPEAKKVAVRALKSALQRDAATGNDIAMAVVTKDGFKVLSDEEIKALK